MKKLYAAVAGMAIMAAGANAQTLYFLGSGEGLSWDPGSELKVELTDGAYTVEIKDLTQFKASTVAVVDGDWDAYNAAAIYGAASGTSLKENLGQPITVEIGNGANNFTPWKGDYKIVIAGDLSTITLTTTTPEPTGFTPLYLRGGFAGTDWPALDEWKLTSEDGINYTFTCAEGQSIPAGSEFKIADADWALYNFGTSMPVEVDDTMYQWEAGSNTPNAVFLEDFNGTCKLVLPHEEDGEMTPVMVGFFAAEEGGVEGVTVDANAAKEYFNLQGVRVANPSNGLYIVRQGGKTSKVLVK